MCEIHYQLHASIVGPFEINACFSPSSKKYIFASHTYEPETDLRALEIYILKTSIAIKEQDIIVVVFGREGDVNKMRKIFIMIVDLG